jgi:hypothetical protein
MLVGGRGTFPQNPRSHRDAEETGAECTIVRTNYVKQTPGDTNVLHMPSNGKVCWKGVCTDGMPSVPESLK